MAGLKRFTALAACVLISLLAVSLTTLPASAFEQLGGVVEQTDAFSQLAGQDQEVSSSSRNVFRRLLEKKKKNKDDDDDQDDDNNDDDDEKEEKKKKKKKIEKLKKKKASKDGKDKYDMKTTDKKKKKKSSGDSEKKKKSTAPVIKKKKSPPPPAKKAKKTKKPVAPAPKRKPHPTPKPNTPAPKARSAPRTNYGGGGNPIDNCWLGSDYRADRKKFVGCAIGFGANAIGGRDGAYYIVTDPSDDAVHPKPGTLRYGIVQLEPLHIYFAHDMDIKLANELIFTSYKTVDGRGAKITIGLGGACFTLQNVQHVIVVGIKFDLCRPGHSGDVISSTVHTGYRGGSDGDAITIFTGTDIWIDHCTLSRAYDGLIDIIHGSDAVTVSNCYFSDHDKVMLFGHSDAFTADKNMKVTVAYNTFGPGLIQRMPRCRHGQFHIINNDYGYGWGIYAIGGSADPTILSEGNLFNAIGASKQVTKRETGGGNSWNWQSRNDICQNGAFFVDSGNDNYNGALSSTASGVAMAYSPALTARSGCLTF